MIFLYLGAFFTTENRQDVVFDAENISAILKRLRQIVCDADSTSSAEAQIEAMAQVLQLPNPCSIDPRVRAAIEAIDDAPNEFDSVSQAADVAGVSVRHFQHLFRSLVGTSFRRYRLWKRMAIVARSLSQGQTLTTAAHEAGFASSAHLSTSFRDTFGIKPSVLLAMQADFRIDQH